MNRLVRLTRYGATHWRVKASQQTTVCGLAIGTRAMDPKRRLCVQCAKIMWARYTYELREVQAELEALPDIAPAPSIELPPEPELGGAA